MKQTNGHCQPVIYKALTRASFHIYIGYSPRPNPGQLSTYCTRRTNKNSSWNVIVLYIRTLTTKLIAKSPKLGWLYSLHTQTTLPGPELRYLSFVWSTNYYFDDVGLIKQLTVENISRNKFDTTHRGIRIIIP